MATKVQDLIEYTGLADSLPKLSDPSSFKQIAIQETLDIPTAKPDMEQIVKVICEVVITKVKAIRTPMATSGEGQKLSGYKAIVEGELRQKIVYVADEPTQSVHGAHFVVPFSNFIVLPSNFKIGTPITVTGYIEDIYASMLTPRKIFKNVVILLTAEF